MAKPLGFLLITFALAACETPQPTSDAGGDTALRFFDPCEGCAPVCVGEIGFDTCAHESGDDTFCRGCTPGCDDGTLADCTRGNPDGTPGELRCATGEPETRYCVRTAPGL